MTSNMTSSTFSEEHNQNILSDDKVTGGQSQRI